MPLPPGYPRGGERGQGTRLCFSRIVRRWGSLRAVIFLLGLWLCLIAVINLGSAGHQSSWRLNGDASLSYRYGSERGLLKLSSLSPTDKRMSSDKVEAKLVLRTELKSSIKDFKSAAKALEDGLMSNFVKDGFISGRRIQEIKISQTGGLETSSQSNEEGLSERETKHEKSTFLSGKLSQIDTIALTNTKPHDQKRIAALEDLQPDRALEYQTRISSLFLPAIQEHEWSQTQEAAKQNLTISWRARISQSKSKNGYPKTRSQDSEMTAETSKYGLRAHEKSISGHFGEHIGDRHNRNSNFYDSSSEIDTYFNGNERQRAREKDVKMEGDHSGALRLEQSYLLSREPLTASDGVTKTQTTRANRPKSNLHRSAAVQMDVPKQRTEYLVKNGIDRTIHSSSFKVSSSVNYPANFSVIRKEIELGNGEKSWSGTSYTKHTDAFYEETLKQFKLAESANELFLRRSEFEEEMSSDVTLENDQLSGAKNRVTLSGTLTSILNGERANNDTSWPEWTATGSQGTGTFKYDGFELYSYNVTASNALQVNRTIPDTRPAGCQFLPAYASTDLPRATVIICFHNEALSVLLRTVHTVLDRTPSHLLERIILVDDFSTQDDLSFQLEEHLNFLDIVLLTRTWKREGLVGARILGASLATSEVIVFLDAHCECNIGWVEPLLFSLTENPQKVVSPYIDTIRSESFQYKQSPSQLRGGFTWRLEFGWRAATGGTGLLEETEPILTPVISGGLFAVRRHYFISMGTYDPELSIWGGENFELSFKTWMCGGSVEIVPCSRVGHVFRSSLPYTFTEGREKTVLRNLARVASVWMDEYADTFYAAVNLPNDLDIGDTSNRTQLRRDLNCKSFKWYLDNVFPEMDIVLPDTVVYGQVRNKGSLMCIDVMNSGLGYYFGLSACNGGRNQTLYLTYDNQLKQGNVCIAPGLNKQLTLSVCSAQIKWIYEKEQLTLNATNLCLTSVDNEIVHLLPCYDEHTTVGRHIPHRVTSNNMEDNHMVDKSHKGDNSMVNSSFQQWTFDYNFNWKRRRRRAV